MNLIVGCSLESLIKIYLINAYPIHIYQTSQY
jgi:hypothetical protein